MRNEQLVTDNLDLAHWVVRRCFPNVRPRTAEWEEYHAIALEGIFHAATKYDPSKGAAFATFAVCCASRFILTWLRKESRRGITRISVERARKTNLTITSLDDAADDAAVAAYDPLAAHEAAEELKAMQRKVALMGSPYVEVMQHEFWGPKLYHSELVRLANKYGFTSVQDLIDETVQEVRGVLCNREYYNG
ncbi:MAG: hypothetical protein N2112_02530 [Gemmataceae bacterium]|nr:hypothetical protein [Gemmataceae bacterium]